MSKPEQGSTPDVPETNAFAEKKKALQEKEKVNE
jgi:hypothetical protein